MRLRIDGADFEVLDEGRGPVLVLLHGFPLAQQTWDAQAAALRGRARVVRFDLRGLGSTNATPGPYLMEQLAGDVAAILDALDLERAVLVGHSLGGYVAFAFYRMFAERCRGLGFICSRAGADDAAAASRRRELADGAEREGMGPVADAFVPQYFAPDVYRDHPELVERIRAIVERTDPRGAAAMLRGMAQRVDSSDLFEELHLPVGVVAGARDALIDLSAARAIADRVASAELDVLDCGHVPLYEAPDALSASLERLLYRCAGPTL
jgi:3-oxoadipate enol-lactonase